MIGHCGGGAVPVDHHIGDIVDEAGAVLGDRVSLASKDIGLGALLDEHKEPSEVTFFVASLLGFVTVSGASWVIWKRAADARRTPAEPG